MVDQTKTEQNIAAVVDAVKAPAKAVAATLEAAAKPAPKTVVKAKTAVRARRARKVNAKVVKAVKKNNVRAATSARRITKAAATGAATQIERTSTMTNDFTQLFAGFQLPGSDKFQGLFADAGARSQDLVTKSRHATEEMTELAKANVEAIAEAARIAAAGAKSIGQDVIASSRTGFEHASEAIKTLADAKSPTEYFQLQSELMRSSFDRMVSESSKLTEQVVKLAGEAIQPISNRASVNAERVNELVA
ncbi:MAG: phasin family protein [Sphingomonas sp.]|nr:phasin family protein [Sphingomonas sp.]